jgi:hypothetical protein
VQITSRVRPHIHGELLNLIRDPDTAYGPLFVRRLRAMGIRDYATAPPSRAYCLSAAPPRYALFAR